MIPGGSGGPVCPRSDCCTPRLLSVTSVREARVGYTDLRFRLHADTCDLDPVKPGYRDCRVHLRARTGSTFDIRMTTRSTSRTRHPVKHVDRIRITHTAEPEHITLLPTAPSVPTRVIGPPQPSSRSSRWPLPGPNMPGFCGPRMSSSSRAADHRCIEADVGGVSLEFSCRMRHVPLTGNTFGRCGELV